MPKPKGAGAAWKSVDNLNKTFSDYIDKIRKLHPKALDLMADYMDDKEAMPQLRFGAAKRIDEIYHKLIKEFKTAKPEDFHDAKAYRPKKTKKEKQKEESLGILSLTFDEEKDGTNN
jgi:hypothetical protein